MKIMKKCFASYICSFETNNLFR